MAEVKQGWEEAPPVEDLPPPPPEDDPGDFWEADKTVPESPPSPSPRGLGLSLGRESNLDFSLLFSPAMLTKETDGNLIAQWLENFFKDVYGQPPEQWVKTIMDTVLFPLVKRPLIAKAFLYGLRGKKEHFSKPQKQEWFRWVLPLFEYSVALKFDENEFSEAKFTEALSLRAKNEYDSLGVVIVVQLLHWAFQNESVGEFSLLLKEIKDKFELLGWTEECTSRVSTIYQAFIAKVNACHAARMRADSELPLWDNLISFIGALEDHVFFSPTYGFAIKPEPDLVGIHIANQGCPDQEMLVAARDMLASLLADGAASASVQGDKMQSKVHCKQRDALRSCNRLLEAGCNYFSTLADALKLSAKYQLIDEVKFSSSINELVEVLSKRPRFAKSSKKQAVSALENAIFQKPVEMLDPWTGVKVVSADGPEGAVVHLPDRWQDQCAVVYLLRRFGCPLCIHQATMLMSLKPALDKHEVRLIAVGNGDYQMAKQFKEGLNWPGEIYLDPESTSYKAIQLKRLSSWEAAKRYFTSLRVLAWFKNNTHKAQNQEGDGLQTGGVFIVGPGVDSTVIFSFKEIDNDPLSFPTPEVIVNACAATRKHKRMASSRDYHDARDID